MAKKYYDVYVPVHVLFTVAAEDEDDAVDTAYSELSGKALVDRIREGTYEVDLDPVVDDTGETAEEEE